MKSATECRECLTVLLEYACQSEFSAQLSVARQLFFLSSGKVHEDDPFFESRMSLFLESFVFDHRLAESYGGATVLETFLSNAQRSLKPGEVVKFEEFRSAHHSVFLIEQNNSRNMSESTTQALVARDLFSGKAREIFCLPDSRFEGFEPGAVVEGRIVTFSGHCFFMNGFVFHPKNVTGLIRDAIKQDLRIQQLQRRKKDVGWRDALEERHAVLAELSEKLGEVSVQKKAIDRLKVTQQLLLVSRRLENPALIMALGRNEEVSPFVPEAPLMERSWLIARLAYCHIKAFRYAHIDCVKVYEAELLHGDAKIHKPLVTPMRELNPLGREFAPLEKAN